MRPWTITVEPWPDFHEEDFYPVRVITIEKIPRVGDIHLALQHLHPDQIGRQTELTIPQPIYLGGIGAEFFLACGQTVEVGMKLTPKECLDRIIKVSFVKNPERNEWQILHCVPYEKE